MIRLYVPNNIIRDELLLFLEQNAFVYGMRPARIRKDRTVFFITEEDNTPENLLMFKLKYGGKSIYTEFI